MANNANLTLAISGDVTNLSAASIIAKSALADLKKATLDAAKGFSELSEEAKGNALAAINKYGLQIKELQNVIRQANGTFKDHAAAHREIGGVLSQNRASFMELEHVVRSASDSFAAGADPLRIFEQEGMRVVQALSELQGISFRTIAAFSGIGAAVAAAGGALAWYDARQKEILAAGDLSASLNARGIKLPKDDVEAFVRSLMNAGKVSENFGQITRESAIAAIESFAQLRQATPELVGALVKVLPDYADMMRMAPAEAAKSLTTALSSMSTKGAEFVEALTHSSEAAANFKQTLDMRGPAAAQAELFDTLSSRLKAYATSADAARVSNTSLGALISGPQVNARGLGLDRAEEIARIADAQRRSMEAQAALREAAAKSSDKDFAPDVAAIQARLAEITQDKSKTSAQQLADQVAYLRQEVAATGGSYAEREALRRMLAAKESELADRQSSEEMDSIRRRAAEAADVLAKQGKDRAAQQEAETAIMRQGLADQALTAEDKLALNREIAQSQLREDRAAGTEGRNDAQEAYRAYVAGVEEKLAADKGHFLQQVELINQWLDRAKAAYGQDSAEYAAAVRKKIEVDEQWAQAVAKHAENVAAAQRAFSEGQASLSEAMARAKPGEFKASVALAFDHSALDAQVAAEGEKLKEALEEKLAGLKIKLDTDYGAGDVKAVAEDYKEMQEAAAGYLTQIQSLNQRAAQTVQESWQKIVTPVTGAFDQILSAAMSRNQNIGVAAEHAALSIAENYLKMGAQVVAHWLATELGMTAATITGTAQRQGADAAAQAAGRAAQAASAVQQVTSDAGVAAAGAYAATASIPIVGPELAPGAAAAALSATMSFASLASAEGGWGNVPADQLAMIHKNEMVLPSSIADSVREMAAAGLQLPAMANSPSLGGSSSTVNSSTTNSPMTLHHNPTINVSGGASPSSADIASALRMSNTHLLNTFNNWRGTGSKNLLPGR